MKKFLPYILIVLILVGILSPALQARAEGATLGTCNIISNNGINPVRTITTTQSDCEAQTGKPAGQSGWVADPSATTLTGAQTGTDFENYVNSHGCGLGLLGSKTSIWPGCFLTVSYGLFYVIPAGLLWLSAYFFNVLISVTLGSGLFTKSPFLSQAWAIVRDISNIFFLLILLYAAFKLILGLGGSEVKKIIARVVLTALVINFSMFLTSIPIDASNILASVFYNKLEVNTKNPDGSVRQYSSATGEKDVAGGMVNAFNPTSLLTTDFFNTAGTITVPGAAPKPGPVSDGVLLMITILAGMIMLFAAYSFFISGLSFVGRMVELFVVVFFSPFAFMSSSISTLEKMEYIGWDAWLKRLLKTAFMAPIFMFFLYFIFLLVHSSVFSGLFTTNTSMVAKILNVVIPAMVILMLLSKATKFAKEGGGVVGEALIKGTEVVMGVSAALLTGGTAMALQGTVGQLSSKVANSEWAKKREAEGKIGSGIIRNAAKYGASASYDARKGAVGGVLKAASGISGINLGHASGFLTKDGGFEADKKRKIEARQKRNEELKVGENEKPTQDLRNAENAQQELLRKNSGTIDEKDRQIKAAEGGRDTSAALLRTMDKGEDNSPERKNWETAQKKAQEDAQKVIDLKGQRKQIKDGKIGTVDPITGETKYNTDNGLRSISTIKAEINDKELKENVARTTFEDATKTHQDAVASLEQIRAAAPEAIDKAVKDAEKSRDAAVANIEIARTAAANARAEATRATQEAALEEQRTSPTSFAPEDIARRETARAAAVKATETATRAEKALAEAQTASSAAESNIGIVRNNIETTMQASIQEAENKVSTAASNIEIAEAELGSRTQETADIKESVRVQIEQDARNRAEGGKGTIGRSINDYEDDILPKLKHDIDTENKGRAVSYASAIENNFLQKVSFINAGMAKGQREAANRIRAGAKLDSGKPH